MKKKLALLLVPLLLTSCCAHGYDDFEFKEQPASTLTPISDRTRVTSYTDEGEVDETLAVFESADGLCRIEQKAHYFDVTVDIEKGGHYAAAKSYGELIREACPSFGEILEPYLYENVYYAFNEYTGDTYGELQNRVNILFESLPTEYQEEITGLAEGVSGGLHGVEPDGIMTYEEIVFAQFIPDAVRSTACSGISIDGTRTKSGSRITSRLMEWFIGTSGQITKAHAVTHFKNGDKSFTSVATLGMLDGITLVNDNGVMASILDVGSADTPYMAEGKKSYTFGVRTAVEEYSNAHDAAIYMRDTAPDYTFCANIFITDATDALCVEMVAAEAEGTPAIRDEDSKLNLGVEQTATGCLFVVNGYMLEGNRDTITNFLHNAIRFKRMNEWFAGDEKFSLGEYKERITSEEDSDDNDFDVIGNNNGAFHLLLVDYATGTMQVSFAVEEPDKSAPVFYDIGGF